MLRNGVSKRAVLAASCIGVISATLQAAPFANYSILGRVVGSGTAYASSVTVSVGSQVEYSLVATFAPLGTVNKSAFTRTLTAIGSADGFNSLPAIDLYQSAGATIDANFSDAGTPQAFVGAVGSSTWASGTGSTRGTPTAGDLINIRNVAGPGTFDFPGNPTFLGSFSIVGATGSASLIQMRFSTATTAAAASGFRIHTNNSTAATGSNIISTNTTESGTDPLWNFVGLNLVQAQTNLSPSFALASGLQMGNTVIDVTLDVVQPADSLMHFATFSIPDAFITDESASTAAVSLGTLPTALQGHVTLNGTRSIVISGSYTDYPVLVGTYTIPLVLTDSGSPSVSSSGALTISIVPEPVSLGLSGLSGALLLRRRRRNDRQ